MTLRSAVGDGYAVSSPSAAPSATGSVVSAAGSPAGACGRPAAPARRPGLAGALDRGFRVLRSSSQTLARPTAAGWSPRMTVDVTDAAPSSGRDSGSATSAAEEPATGAAAPAAA